MRQDRPERTEETLEQQKAAQEQTYHRMLEAPVGPLVCRLAVP